MLAIKQPLFFFYMQKRVHWVFFFSTKPGECKSEKGTKGLSLVIERSPAVRIVKLPSRATYTRLSHGVHNL